MNSKRIFVTNESIFTISVYFTKDGEMKAAKTIPQGEEGNWEKFDIDFVLPDYGTAKMIMRNCVAIVNGDQVLNVGAFQDALLCATAKKWNLVDEDGKEIPLDIQKLNTLRPDITRLFIELLQEKLTKEGLYGAVMFS